MNNQEMATVTLSKQQLEAVIKALEQAKPQPQEADKVRYLVASLKAIHFAHYGREENNQ